MSRSIEAKMATMSECLCLHALVLSFVLLRFKDDLHLVGGVLNSQQKAAFLRTTSSFFPGTEERGARLANLWDITEWCSEVTYHAVFSEVAIFEFSEKLKKHNDQQQQE